MNNYTTSLTVLAMMAIKILLFLSIGCLKSYVHQHDHLKKIKKRVMLLNGPIASPGF